MHADASVTVAVCVVTYLRPRGLAVLLDAIDRLVVDDHTSIRVTVVDNDVRESAREVVASHIPSRFPVEYFVEPRRGIPFARNRALDVAGDAHLIAFFDDDEEPEPTWLREMLALHRATGAPVVVGPSVPAFAPGTPAWVVAGQFFERRRFGTGQCIAARFARTSGVLVAPSALPPSPVFDTRYPLAGGSDSALFHRLERAGCSIVWNDGARMIEHVPRSRATTGWLVRRRYRMGNARSIIMLRLDEPSVGRRVARIGRGGLTIVTGVLAVLGALPRGRVDVVRGLQRVAYGAGLITGVFGIAYQEYRVVHGA